MNTRTPAADHAEATLYPYTGQRQRQHFHGGEVSPRVLAEYGDDNSGTKQYRFNRAGFRGEDFDPAASHLLVACGCSLTFGVGLDQEETWPHRFKQQYAASIGRPEHDVNLLNFSHGGCSNDYIARALLNQVPRLRPDLVLVHFTFSDRAEGLEGNESFDIAPWLLESSLQQPIPWGDQIQGYYLAHSEELGLLNALKNMLLVQFAYQASGTPYLFAWVDHHRLKSRQIRDHAILSPLAALLDTSRVCPFSINDVRVDLAADGTHPGPQSNRNFAERLFEHYRSLAPEGAPAVTPGDGASSALPAAASTPDAT